MTADPISNPMRILIVEDHKASADALCRILVKRIEGCECTVAGRLDTGLKLARERRHDITLLDIGLPDAGSDQVIISIPLFPKPVIVITDLEDYEVELKCFAYEADNFFTKKRLRETIDTNEGADLIRAITNAHWRHSMPARRREAESDLGTYS